MLYPLVRMCPLQYTWDIASLFCRRRGLGNRFAPSGCGPARLAAFSRATWPKPAAAGRMAGHHPALHQQLMKVAMYARLNSAVDAADQASAALNSRAGGLIARASRGGRL